MLWTDFRKIMKFKFSLKSVQWEPRFSTRTDGQRRQTDLTKLIVAFRNVANLPKKKRPFFQHNDNRFYERRNRTNAGSVLYGTHIRS